MTSTNTPNSNTPENSETQKKYKNWKSIEALIKKVSTWKTGGFDPYIRNKLDNSVDSRNKMITEIRENMRASFDEDEYGFENDVINSLSDGELRWYLEKYSRNLVALRKNTPKVIYKYFPDAQIDVRSLDADIREYSEKEIENILENSTSIKKYLREALDIDTTELTLWKPRFREIFEPENIPEWDLKNRLIKAIDRFEKANTPLDTELIREIVWYYDQDYSKIERIAKEFDITLSISDAIRAGLISTEEVDVFTKNLYSDIWLWLSEDQKNQFKVEVRNDSSLKFSFEELKEIHQELSKSYSTKKFKDVITSRLSSRIDDFINNSGRPSLTTTFAEFTDKITSGKTKIPIHPVQELREWSIMVCRDRWGKMRFLKIEKIDQELSISNGIAGMTLSFLDGIEDGTIGRAKWWSTTSYENLEQKLAQMEEIQVMNESDFRWQIEEWIWKDENRQTIRDASLEEDEYSFEYLKNKIDNIDGKGKNIEIKEWMVFSARVDITDAKWKKSKINQSFTVLKVDKRNNTIYFSNWKDKDNEQATFYEFAKAVEEGIDFHRIAILNSDADFYHALSGLVEDFPSSIHIKDGKLVPDHHDEHNDHGWDNHGHNDHAKNPTIEYFKTGEGDWHIRLFEIGSDFVSFGEYDPPSGVDLEKIRQAKWAKKLSKSKEKGFYGLRTMTRAQFLVYLKDNKFKATTEDLLDPHAGYHPHDPHMHGGGIMWLFKWPSLNDIFKGFSNITHGIEHYFEKNSKLNASRFALQVGRKFGFPLDIMAQLQADEVSSMKEIIEKIWDKLGNLNGPVGRKKALHIAQLTSSSAEEVGAAMLHMVKWYGHLYAEDIAYANGSESFINWFLYSLGWKSTSEINHMKREARSKYLGDLWSGSDGSDVSEEEMMWWLLKIIDGGAGRDKSDPKYDPRFANAGAVAKAMWGPSGWKKAWNEGIKWAYEKWLNQWADTVNAEGRVNKGLSAAKTFELNTLQWFMEKAAGKSPDPSIQTLPVLWALAGYSKHASSPMKQSVKSYGDSKWHTFHAYAFLRNFDDNETYTKTFIKALHDMDPVVADKARNAISALRNWPKEKPNDKPYENAVDTIAEIWKNFQWKWLHDDLQWKSTWLMKKINENDQDVIKYANKFASIHLMNSKEWSPSDDNGWTDQFGVNTSWMFWDNKGNATKEQDGKQVLSIAATLNKLPINWYEFEKNSYDRLWPVVVWQFQKLESETDENLKKAQYKQFREDVITHFRNRMSIRAWGKDAAVKEVTRKDYYKGLSYMGIDPGELFEDTPIHIHSDIGYKNWKDGTWKNVHRWVQSVEDWVSQSTSKAINRKSRTNEGLYK
jgi:hypothetical protein